MSLAFGQSFSKVLFVYKEFCDYGSGTSDVVLFSIVVFKTLDISQGPHLRCGGIFSELLQIFS